MMHTKKIAEFVQVLLNMSDAFWKTKVTVIIYLSIGVSVYNQVL